MQVDASVNSYQEPKILSYIHIFEYFRDYYQYRKSLDEKFSYEIWSNELGFKSRSQMRMIASAERNATDLVIQKFSQYNKLSEADQNHLYRMMHYSKATTAIQKKLYLDQILENLETNSKSLDVKKYIEFLSNKELPLLQLLLGIPDFVGTEENIKEMLGISGPQLQKYLKTLEKLQLVTRQSLESQKEAVWSSVSNNFKVPDEYQSEALKIYHRETIEEMQQMLDANPILRRFRSIMFTLAEKDFPEFIDDMENFLKKAKVKYGAQSIEDKRIFKLNLNAYPVTSKYK